MQPGNNRSDRIISYNLGSLIQSAGKFVCNFRWIIPFMDELAVMVMSRSLPGAVQGIKKSTNFNVDRKYNFTSGGI